ncbi:hypothetical protein C5167_044683 [Papaver somniferum]|nr:hypothetical protein C5167_044683 [Papaver somniferum]
MSSSSSTQTIEHIVLFKVNEKTEPTKINTMLNRLNNLIALDQVLHLSAGPIFRNKSASSLYNFTHLLHSRYKSKEDLNAYGFSEIVKRVVLSTIGGIKNGVGRDCIEQISFGENFCARAKGFSIGSIAVCREVEELDMIGEVLEKEKEKFRDLLDGVIVLDYVVPNSLSLRETNKEVLQGFASP